MPTDKVKLVRATESIRSMNTDPQNKSTDSSVTEPPRKRAKVHVTCRKKKKLRSLVLTGKSTTKKSYKCLKLFGIFSVIFGITVFLWKNEHFRDELKHVAMNQFQLYLHGRENYCNEPFEHWHISNALYHRIVGQEAGLNEIEYALQHHKNVTALAYVGTQGVGKTLTLNLIQKHFQWHLNIQQYIWSLIQTPDEQLEYLVQLIDGLTTCGQNGIFIDNVPLIHIKIIKAFNQKLLAYCNENNIKLMVIYVIQTNNPFEASKPLLIDNLKTINFRQFNTDDIRNCVNMEMQRLKISIKQQQIEDILADYNPKRHGCKHVAARIARNYV